ncbi:MAG: 30S ribosomal protein S8 [Candidatus Yanofskybacteria bacterium RIFCSPLOWO2_12_FULL_44_13b]|uniref:Small ribosomal subunit protein uS8 n=2 Tax=Candidatus Yanofskyibacteriota TaxID=1752733 RepID=A0A1F8H116_9BACT|nr:MAG: 30S ribosomal protein S8 [Candidatus Yanofskybacteria bacterium RIFCSPHIGHO2_01_FULL_44_110b]OGN14835.1 MAG: 30S ribosomal protein S8 [Candidatus Yanofskybacteria bacterium RIFCSPHIGHO2_02_FULL_44_36b]OGN19113.1 MAG: 30S ribosomal protein S8 [Candidatus Yanofskybacteria bacterium RIFCSPHIGHO2_12_FULL_44_29b]OGN26368.1 MAG: 30S ribosomal protein S8 [Candidatus Yanofskybacteria bacterium RIFCSPLOWO2_01_FULL_44_88]OGN31375.1 MAG: 30S ribosomal protein S8 [Candidatus Yanofskybacteria bacter
MVTDPISDMLIQIKNAQLSKKEQVSIPFSKMKMSIADILKSSGFVADVEKKSKKMKNSEHDYIYITLKYGDGTILNNVKIVSKPSRRMYMKASEIRPVRSGYGLAILSTSRGIMTSENAKKEKLGGEILCEVW